MILCYDELAEVAADFIREFNLPIYDVRMILEKHYPNEPTFTWKALLQKELRDGQEQDSTESGASSS